MPLPTIILKDRTLNKGAIYSAAAMPPIANQNEKPVIKESRATVMNRLTMDISDTLRREQGDRMMRLVHATNMQSADICFCNVRAAGHFFLASLKMIEDSRDRRQIIHEFDMLSNEFLR